MSRKAAITEEMIVDAAFEIARTEGAESVNARRIATELGCTTQPVLYHFSSVLEIKAEVYMRADGLLSEYLSNISGNYKSPLIEFCMQHIKFAYEESNLFRLLFQSEVFESKGFEKLMDGEYTAPVIDFSAYTLGIDNEKANDIFAGLFLMAHGIAGMIANSSMEYDEKYITGIIEGIYDPLIEAVKADGKGRGKVNFRSFFEKK